MASSSVAAVVAPWLVIHRVRDALGAFKAGAMEEGRSLHPRWVSVVTPGTNKTLKALEWAMGAGLVTQ